MKKRIKTEHGKEYNRNYMRAYDSTPRGRYNHLRSNSKVRGIEVTISAGEFVAWFESTTKECEYCGQPLRAKREKTKLDSLTIDRKDNASPYQLDNLVMSCRRCNFLKGSWLTYEQTKEIAAKYFNK